MFTADLFCPSRALFFERALLSKKEEYVSELRRGIGKPIPHTGNFSGPDTRNIYMVVLEGPVPLQVIYLSGQKLQLESVSKKGLI